MFRTSRIVFSIHFLVPEKKKFLSKFQKNEIFEKSFGHTCLFHSIFKWHHSIHREVPKGLVMDLKNVENETNKWCAPHVPGTKAGYQRQWDK